MTWNHLIAQVRDRGRYDSDQEAADVLRAVLAALGGRLVGEERCELAAVLPVEARTHFAAQIPLTEHADAPAFVATVADALNAAPAQARWHTTSALAALAEVAGQSLTDRILAGLPRGYALLFCRADLQAAA
ncbi:DUF2267 domain-containing protein [Actinacidiphila bryophytorum]|uniref:DUF2267 domain-containing protein n=1 Tax=Actinacidiphila bryophytorum TaxID=1436133 RepID=A0A9W4MI65_9ACTN|nr:DUF2267 domain-containing protein [Actinacidiphila bryophytorum]MBM9438309.1 DUF2267 domain-containing protein [Actinacidiphila bryophytorum]MBN6545566.1 DUF2267 domain-containing protein [Actinacidiphila bryophytorum]CAG7657965.1 conserved hypothetical protein [Actinacidiphila bryophytorum]